MALTMTAAALGAAIKTEQDGEFGNEPWRAKERAQQLATALAANIHDRAAYAVLTPAAEAADVIAVTVQLKDAAGDDLAEAAECMAEVYQLDGTKAATVGASGFGVKENGAGAPLEGSDNTGLPTLFFSLDANGAAQLDVKDEAGGADTKVFLVVTVFGTTARAGRQTKSTLTFDNA